MNNKNIPATLVGDREIASTRFFDAPRELVFKMWTDPEHIGRWWGPRGFTTTTFHMDVKPGGVWRFVMHGPDGTDYENNVTYLEVFEPERLVYQHGGAADGEPVNFHVTVTFESVGSQTKLTMRMVFPSADKRDFVVKTHGALEGLDGTLGRLEEQVARRNEPPEEFVTSRTFDAPRELVWKAWTERDRLMQWFGPKGFTMTTANLDLRPGGSFLYAMRGSDGMEMWGKFEYREIVPPRRMVFVNYFSDASGGITRHPLSPTWPLKMLSTTTLAENEGKTTVTIRWRPIDPTPEELRTFNATQDGMRMGWAGTFDRLGEYLAKSNSGSSIVGGTS